MKTKTKRNLFKLAGLTIALAVIATIAGCASMQLESVEQDTVEGPKQVRQGQDIDPKDITVWGIYKDGSRKKVTIVSGDISFNKNATGTQTVSVKVGLLGNQVVTFQTEVMALRSFTLASPPSTVSFKQGQQPDPAWPGLALQGDWDQMGSGNIDIKSCEITGLNKDQVGRQTVRVSYAGRSVTFDVTFQAMTGLQIAQPPSKLEYIQGDSLNLAGLKVMDTWEGLPAEELTVSMEDITGFNPNTIGTQRVVVTKGGRTVSFNVQVAPKPPILPAQQIEVYPANWGDINVNGDNIAATARSGYKFVKWVVVAGDATITNYTAATVAPTLNLPF
jgi:hypothetical protein